MKQLPDIQQNSIHHPDGSLVTPASYKTYGYYYVTRAKKSHQWTVLAFCYCAGDICLASAEDYFRANGYMSENYSLAKLVDAQYWHKLQVTQHLKSLKIKPLKK